MRHYLPGLGRFMSRVHLHEAVALGRTTYEELRQVWGVNIGPLGTPEAFAGGQTPEHAYVYAENNPVNRIDPSGLQSCQHGLSCQQHRAPRPTPGYTTAAKSPGTKGAGAGKGMAAGGLGLGAGKENSPFAATGGGSGASGGVGTSTDYGYCEWFPPGQGPGIGSYVCHCPASQKKGWTCTVFPPPGRGGPHRGMSATIDCSGCGKDHGKCHITFHTWNEMAGKAAAVRDWPTKEAPCFNPAGHRGPPATKPKPPATKPKPKPKPPATEPPTIGPAPSGPQTPDCFSKAPTLADCTSCLDLPEDPWQVWNTCVTCCNTGSAVNPQTFPFNDCYKTCKDWIDLHQLAPPDEDGEGDED